MAQALKVVKSEKGKDMVEKDGFLFHFAKDGLDKKNMDV